MTEDAGALCVTTIDLLRHGESSGGSIFRGSTDSELSALGLQQMHDAVANVTTPWQRVISSPLQRCLEFARQLDPACEVEAGFSEIDFGDWEGQAVDTVYQQHAAAVDAFWQNPLDNTPPNGETLRHFQTRVVDTWQRLLPQCYGQRVLIVTHGGVIRILLAALLDMPLRPVSRLAVPHACRSQIKLFHEAGKPLWPQLIFHNPDANDGTEN